MYPRASAHSEHKPKALHSLSYITCWITQDKRPLPFLPSSRGIEFVFIPGRPEDVEGVQEEGGYGDAPQGTGPQNRALAP